MFLFQAWAGGPDVILADKYYTVKILTLGTQHLLLSHVQLSVHVA